MAAMAVGLAQGALDEAIAYAKERQAFGQPIMKFQAIQAKIATSRPSSRLPGSWSTARLSRRTPDSRSR